MAKKPCLLELVDRDLQAQRKEYIFPITNKLTSLLVEDARDSPAFYLVCNVACTTLPTAVFLLMACSSHTIGAAYLAVNYALYLQRFMLTLHFTEHRRLFKKEYHALNYVVPFVLSPLYGVPPGLYRPHHVVMHHVEDNKGGHDASSTEIFQRDNFLHFVVYWFRFWVGAWFELPAYALARNRKGLLTSTISSELVWWAIVATLWRYNWVGTLWTLVLPFMLSSFLAMFGNWSQHVFVDPDSPHDTYKSTYNCVDCPDNCKTYNDGYHIIHHLNSRLHWSELPKQLLETAQQHDEHDGLVFHSIGFFDVGLAVFTGRLGYLADHIVPCGPRQAARSRDEWVQLLQHRLKPVKRQEEGNRSKKSA